MFRQSILQCHSEATDSSERRSQATPSNGIEFWWRILNAGSIGGPAGAAALKLFVDGLPRKSPAALQRRATVKWKLSAPCSALEVRGRSREASWCYLLLPLLCLIVNRFSSVGYISEFSFFSAIFSFWNFFLLFFSCLESGFGVLSLQPGETRLAPPSGGAEEPLFSFFVFIFFLFFISTVSPLNPPLGRSPPSSRRSFTGGTFLEVGTGLLGFQALAPPGPSYLFLCEPLYS